MTPYLREEFANRGNVLKFIKLSVGKIVTKKRATHSVNQEEEERERKKSPEEKGGKEGECKA